MPARTQSRAGTELALIAVSALAAVAIVLAFHGPAPVVAGSALALVLPGFAMTRALFPGSTLPVLERVTLWVTLSLVTLALGGIGMYAGGARLSRLSWAELGAGVTIVAGFVGYLRQRRRHPSTVDSTEPAPVGSAAPVTLDRVEPGAVPPQLSTRRAVVRLAPLAAVVVLLGGAVALSWYSANRQDAVVLTELSIVPAGPQAPGAPTKQVVIGVICREQQTTQYRVLLRGPEQFEESFTPRIRQGATWARTVTVPAYGTVTVDLYRATDRAPYRSVHLG